MFKFTAPEQVPQAQDLRQGLRGTLVVHEPNLAGAMPQHRLDDPLLVSPGVAHPVGQTTHN